MEINIETNIKKISVIVPVYNAAKYLINTIDSILSQTYKEFELILIDDGSKDNSLKLCNSISEKDKRVIVLHQENQGASAARNAGIKIARGKYICFIDSDDYIESDMLECLMMNAEKYDVDISCCGLVQVALDGKVKNHYCYGEKEYFTDMEKIMKKFFINPVYKEILYGPYNKLIRSEIVKEIGFNTKYIMGEDLLFNFECLEKAKSFYLENRELYHYIKRENSVTTSKFAEKDLDYIYVADILLKKVKERYPNIVEVATIWNYQKKLNICRRFCINKEYKRKYKNFYYEWKNFCIKNKKVVWKKITKKNRLEYIILCYCPWLFEIIKKFTIIRETKKLNKK